MTVLMLKTVKIRSYETGLYFRDGEFRGLLDEGRHWFFDPLGKVRVEVVSRRDPWLVHDKLDVIVRSGALKDRAVVLDLKDHQRALVWIDGRFSHVLPPGLYAYWTTHREVAAEGAVDAVLRDEQAPAQPQRLAQVALPQPDRLGVGERREGIEQHDLGGWHPEDSTQARRSARQ